MGTCSPPSPPKVKREAGQAKGQSSKGAGVTVTTMDPQDEVAPSVPGKAGLRAVQSLSNNNTKISTSPLAHHLAAIRQVFGMPSPSEELEPGEIRQRLTLSLWPSRRRLSQMWQRSPRPLQRHLPTRVLLVRVVHDQLGPSRS